MTGEAADRDRAAPEQLRQASRDTDVSALALHGSLLASQLAGGVLAAGPFSGQAADYFRAAVGSVSSCLATARDSQEQVARALRQVAGPIEDEQRARQRLSRARRELTDARDRLSDVEADRAAARSELVAAQGELAAQQARIAIAEAANLVRVAAGGSPAPVDTSALPTAERRVRVAEQAVAEAERRVRQAADWVEEGSDRTDRARRTHDATERARETAVRAFATACLAARVPLSLPQLGAGLIELGPLFSAEAGTDQLRAYARAQLDLLRLGHSFGDGFSTVDLEARVGARAGASGGARFGPDGAGVDVEAGGFAGAEAGVTGTLGDEDTFSTSAGAAGRLGVGVDGHAGASFEDGELTIGGGAGAAFGFGGKVSGEVTVNPGGLFEAFRDAPRTISKIKDWLD